MNFISRRISALYAVYDMTEHILPAVYKCFDQIMIHEYIQFISAAKFRRAPGKPVSLYSLVDPASVGSDSVVFNPQPVSSDMQFLPFFQDGLQPVRHRAGNVIRTFRIIHLYRNVIVGRMNLIRELLCFLVKILFNFRMHPEADLSILHLDHSRQAHHSPPRERFRVFHLFWHPHPCDHHPSAVSVYIGLRRI